MKIVIVGYDQMFSNLILGTLQANHKVVGVLRHERILYHPFVLFLKDIFSPGKDYTFLKSLKLHEIKARSVNSKVFKKEILRLNPDIIFVGSWSEKFKKDIIDLPKIATINCHPSILPKYRGPNPYVRVIMNDEKETGITFHLMDEKYDRGPILHQKKIEIIRGFNGDTGDSIKNKCCNLAKSGVCELLQSMNNEIIIPINQIEKEASYYSHVCEDDILIDFAKSAEEIDRKIRALTAWQFAYIPHKHTFFKIVNYKFIENYTGFSCAGMIIKKGKNRLHILTGDNKIMVLSNYKLYGRRLRPLFTGIYTRFVVQCGDVCL